MAESKPLLESRTDGRPQGTKEEAPSHVNLIQRLVEKEKQVSQLRGELDQQRMKMQETPGKVGRSDLRPIVLLTAI